MVANGQKKILSETVIVPYGTKYGVKPVKKLSSLPQF
jgi:hypothetical protein